MSNNAVVALPGEQPVRTADAMHIAPAALNALNLAAARALLAESQVREAEARLVACRMAAQHAAREFAALRQQISAELGVQLGQSHGWDERTGEVREAQRPSGPGQMA